jgi:type 1 fimbria pilin
MLIMRGGGKMSVPTDGMVITKDTVLQPGVYHLPNGVTIAADGVTLDGNGALLIGNHRTGVGVRVEGRQGVTIKGLRLREYYHGI